MAPANKSISFLKQTVVAVLSTPITSKHRSSTQENNHMDRNNTMFSQILEALQATTSQIVALIDRISNIETQQALSLFISDKLNNILQRSDYLEKETRLIDSQ